MSLQRTAAHCNGMLIVLKFNHPVIFYLFEPLFSCHPLENEGWLLKRGSPGISTKLIIAMPVYSIQTCLSEGLSHIKVEL